jgi:TP901 family phage tail tape measure protein
MAKFVNELTLDTKGFVAGIQQASKAAAGLGTKQNVVVGADTSGAVKNIAAVATELEGLEGTQIKIEADTGTIADDARKIANALDDAAKEANKLDGNLQGAGGKAKGLGADIKGAFAGGILGGGVAGLATAGVDALVSGFGAVVKLGQEYETALKSVSAVTGVTGAALDDIGQRARDLAVAFGGSATEQLEVFQVTLSKIGPQLAQSPKDLETFANNVNVLSKTDGALGAAGAVDALTGSLLQFGVDVNNSNAVAQESSRFINVLAASAAVGSASVSQVAESIAVVGATANNANVTFEETNAALQVLASKSLTGSQAGTALTAVLVKLQSLPADANEELKKLGTSSQELGELLTTKGLGPAVGKLRESMEKLGTQAEKNALLNKIFGEGGQNAAAALLGGGDMLEQFTKGVTGTNSATEQAAINMDTLAERISRASAAAQDIGISVFKAVAPAINDLITIVSKAFSIISNAVGPAFTSTFAVVKDAFKSVATVVGPILTFIGGQIISNLVQAMSVAAGNVKVAFSIIKAVFDGIKQAVQPVIDAFAGLSGAIDSDPVDIFSAAMAKLSEIITTVYDVIAAIASGVIRAAFSLLAGIISNIVKFIVGLIDVIVTAVRWVRDIATAIGEWALSFDFVRTAITAIIGFVKGLIDNVKGLFSAVSDFLGLGGDAAKESTEAVKENEAAVGDAAAAVAELGKEQNAAAAAAKGQADANKKLREELAALQKQIDEVNNTRAKSAEMASTDDIANDIEKQRKRLEIEKQFQDKAFAEELAAIKGNGAVALKQRELLNVRKLQSDEEYQRKVAELDRKTGEATLKALIEGAKLRAQNAAAVLDGQIKDSEAQLAAGNTSTDNLSKLLEARTAKMNTATQNAVNAVVEATQEFKNTEAQILLDVRLGKVDAADGLRQIEEVRRKLEIEFTTVPGRGNEVANNIRRIYADAEEAAAKAQKELANKVRAQQIELIQSEELKKIEKAVFELEKQRDLLLQNRALTAGQQEAIIADTADKIDKLRNVAVGGAADTLKGIAKKVSAIQFDFSGLVPSDGISEEVQKKIDGVTANLRDGKISLQEASKQLQELQGQGVEVGNIFVAIGKTIAKETIKAASKGALGAVQEALAAVENLRLLNADRQKQLQAELEAQEQLVRDNSVLAEEEKLKQIAALQEKYNADKNKLDEQTAQSSVDALETIGVGAAAQFAGLIAEGKTASEAIKQVAGDVVRQLVALYTPSIIALFSSVIPPPFGKIAAGVAIAGIQALLSSVLNGFKDGGYTGGGGTSDVAGVVHKREFVMPEPITTQHRKLFDHIYADKPLGAFPALEKAMHAAQIVGSGQMAASIIKQFDGLHLSVPTTQAPQVVMPQDVGTMQVLESIAHRLQAIPDEKFLYTKQSVSVGFDERADKRYRRILQIKRAR